MAFALILFLVLVVVVIFLFSSLKIAREYERGVVFRLGRLIGLKGPGLFVLIPFIDRAIKVDLRTVTLNVPPQEVITRDNVTAKVNAVAYFRVVDASKAVVQVENYLVATSQIAQTTLRSVLGRFELDELLAQRGAINVQLQSDVDVQTEPWGVKVSAVEMKDVELPAPMQRAIARQAEAERERRAKVIAAEGEFEASAKLSQAAAVIAKEPTALQLRYLQTMVEMSNEQSSTIVIPFPMEIARGLFQMGGNGKGSGGVNDGAASNGPPTNQ